MDVAVKTIMKKNIPKTQSLLKKEIDILRVNIHIYIISLYYTFLNIIFKNKIIQTNNILYIFIIFGGFGIIHSVLLYFIKM